MTPDGWEHTTLGAVVAASDGLQTGPFGAQLHASDYVPDGVPVVMPKDLAGNRIITDSIARVPERLAAALLRHRIVSGDILFSRRGDVGRYGLVTDKERGWLCGTGCLRARLDAKKVSPRFLTHALSWAPSVQWLTENAVGQTMLNLNTSILGRLPILLPPLPEQRKIAAILSAVDDAIDGTQSVLDQLQVVKKAMMAQLLTRGLPGRHTRFKQTEIGEVPAEWEILPLGRLAELQPGFPFKSSEFSAGGDRLLRGSNVGVGVLDWSPAKTVYFPSNRRGEVLDYSLSVGDIIIAMDRPFISEGFKIARVAEEDLPALLLQRVGRFHRYSSDRIFFGLFSIPSLSKVN